MPRLSLWQEEISVGEKKCIQESDRAKWNRRWHTEDFGLATLLFDRFLKDF
jgi:hypothetical protein